jgi:hypothetical protein
MVPAAIQVPALGEYSSAVFRLFVPLMPPATSTLPLVVPFDEVPSWVMLCNRRPFAIEPVAAHVPEVGS